MPTTANFSLEYPDDNSSVDIAGHFETLADDVDTAINTRLALTGGTLTGALAGTLTTDSSSSTTGAFKTAGGMGIAKALYVGTTLNVTGATTLTGDLTVSKAAAALNITSSDTGYLLLSGATSASFRLQTSGSSRWIIEKNSTAESGSNAGSDLVVYARTDAGGALSTPLTITRSTGATTLTGDLTISKASPFLTVYATSGNSYVLVNRPAGSVGGVALQTNNATRWLTSVTNTVESGSNAGSDFGIQAYNDAGALLSTPLTITRSTGAVTLTGDLTVNKGDAQFTLGSGSGAGIVLIKGAAGNARNVRFATGTSLRWAQGANTTAESGSNAGSDYSIYRYSDAGSAIDAPLSITRSTGAVTLTGDLTVSKATAAINVTASSSDSEVRISKTNGNAATAVFRQAGVERWKIGASSANETGSNVGSDFWIGRYNDAGSYQDMPFVITRSTGAVTLTGTLNGKVVNDLVTGPASATDNALVRFDNTTGKVVQNSGITVDDSGNVTSDLTVSKASPVVEAVASSGSPVIRVNAAAGTNRDFRFLTSGTNRWAFRANNVPEASTADGSDFLIGSWNNSGVAASYNHLYLWRNTGKTTLGSVGATAGLELGSSGPRIMRERVALRV